MIASVVVFESYCASYAAFLNVVELSSPFHSVADLYANTDFKVGGLKGTSYKSKLVFSLKQMVESGQVKISWTRFKQKKREVWTKKWNKIWFNLEFQDCLDTGSSTFSFVTLKGMFLLLGLAFITSLVIMVVEYLVRYYKQLETKPEFRNHIVSQENGLRNEAWK